MKVPICTFHRTRLRKGICAGCGGAVHAEEVEELDVRFDGRPLPPGPYVSFKGQPVELIETVQLSADDPDIDLEMYVVYVHDGRKFTQPAARFVELIDGVPRFRPRVG